MIDKMYCDMTTLEAALDGAWLRNEAISNNLANVDTPGYKRQTVQFEEALKDAINSKNIKGYTTHSNHIPINNSNLNSFIKISKDSSNNQMRIDGNNVDIDSEISSMVKNDIYYKTLVQQLSKQFKMLKDAVNGGR